MISRRVTFLLSVFFLEDLAGSVSNFGQIFNMNNVENCFKNVEDWAPCKDLLQYQTSEGFGIMILNTPINFSFNPNFVINLWNKAKVRITVDGGTKRWMKWLTMNECEFDNVLYPDLITGDMDSLPKDVLKLFTSCNTEVIETPDQSETDFFKAIKELKKYCLRKSFEIDTIYVLADSSGRFDQIMSNINTLFKARYIVPDIRIFLIASGSLTWLLNTGSHVIHVPDSLRDNEEWCALLPIGEASTITSSGLKWNLENGKLEFGGMVSSSNTYDGSSVVTIKTDKPVIWSMSIETLL